jgi:hypothetical protein
VARSYCSDKRQTNQYDSVDVHSVLKASGGFKKGLEEVADHAATDFKTCHICRGDAGVEPRRSEHGSF